MEESQELKDFLEIDNAERLDGSELILTNDGFSVRLKAVTNWCGIPQVRVDFIPPASHYAD